MLELIGLIAAGAATVFGYMRSRIFARTRLAYVDAAHRPWAPWLAGAVAWVAATPIVWVLPVVGGGTALLFGAGVALGVAAGTHETRRRLPSS